MPKYYVTRSVMIVYEVEAEDEYNAHAAAYSIELDRLGSLAGKEKLDPPIIQHECYKMVVEKKDA